MTVRTENDLLTNLFQDGQADNSITAGDMRDLIESVKYLGMGAMSWEFVYDNDYNAVTPFTVTDGTRAQITIAPNPGETLKYPPTAQSCWDSNDNKLQPPTQNGFGIIRLSFLAVPANANIRFDVQLDVSATGLGNTIYEQTSIFAKSAAPESYNYIIPVFSGADFAANGGKFFVQPSGGNIDIYRTTLTVFKAFAPNPAA